MKFIWKAFFTYWSRGVTIFASDFVATCQFDSFRTNINSINGLKVEISMLHICFWTFLKIARYGIFGSYLLSFPQNERKIYKLRQLSLSDFVYFFSTELFCQLFATLIPRLESQVIILMTWICYHFRKVNSYTWRN